MDWIQALALGVLQGITEFLPISSTAHLSLLEYYWDLAETPRFFDVMLHVGTLAAVTVFYRRTLVDFAKSAITGRAAVAGSERRNLTDSIPRPTAPDDLLPHARKLTILLIAATLPAVLAAVVFRPQSNVRPGLALDSTRSADISLRHRIGNWREHSSHRPGLVAFFLACTGCTLMAASRLRSGNIGPADFGWRHALAMGVAQACSVTCPGLSRSGMTISAAMLCRVEPCMAVHFSLLMSLPAIVGALALKFRDLDASWLNAQNIAATAVGVAASALVGWCCILLLLRSVQRRQWWIFGIYVLALAAFVGILLLRP